MNDMLIDIQYDPEQDTHGDFGRVAKFCEQMETEKEDILIILGDAGINYYGGKRDQKTKALLESLPITFFLFMETTK